MVLAFWFFITTLPDTIDMGQPATILLIQNFYFCSVEGSNHTHTLYLPCAVYSLLLPKVCARGTVGWTGTVSEGRAERHWRLGPTAYDTHLDNVLFPYLAAFPTHLLQ